MTTQQPLALFLSDVRKQYGDHVALDGVSVEVPEGAYLVYWVPTAQVKRR